MMSRSMFPTATKMMAMFINGGGKLRSAELEVLSTAQRTKAVRKTTTSVLAQKRRRITIRGASSSKWAPTPTAVLAAWAKVTKTFAQLPTMLPLVANNNSSGGSSCKDDKTL